MRAKGAIWHFLVFGVIAICLGVVLTVLSAVDILPDSSSRAGAFWELVDLRRIRQRHAA